MKFSLLLYEVGGQLHVTNPNPMMTIYLGGERAVLDYLKAFICPCHAASIINGGEFWTDRVQNSNCLFVFFSALAGASTGMAFRRVGNQDRI